MNVKKTVFPIVFGLVMFSTCSLAQTNLPRSSTVGADAVKAVSTVSNVTGVWFDVGYSGVGFTIVKASSSLTMLYYGYRNDGSPQWLISTSNYSNDVIKDQPIAFTLNTSTAGNGATFTRPPSTAASGTSYWGSVSLTFSSCSSATATMQGQDGSVSYQLIRLVDPVNSNCID